MFFTSTLINIPYIDCKTRHKFRISQLRAWLPTSPPSPSHTLSSKLHSVPLCKGAWAGASFGDVQGLRQGGPKVATCPAWIRRAASLSPFRSITSSPFFRRNMPAWPPWSWVIWFTAWWQKILARIEYPRKKFLDFRDIPLYNELSTKNHPRIWRIYQWKTAKRLWIWL